MAFMLVSTQFKLSWVPLALGEKAPRRHSAVEGRKDLISWAFFVIVIALWVIFAPVGLEREDVREQQAGVEQLEPTP